MNINTISAAANTAERIPADISMPAEASNKAAAAQRVQNQQTTVTKAKNTPDTNFSKEETQQLAAEMNEIMDDLQTSLGFSITEDKNHQVIVEITDRKTNEIIKQIPSEELLAIKEKMEELTGLMLDRSV